MMTIEEAIQFFKKAYPDKEPIGYWEDGNQIVLNVRPQLGHGFTEVCQYVVKSDGTVCGTNPIASPVIGMQKMKKL